jgi:hypothetical protein
MLTMASFVPRWPRSSRDSLYQPGAISSAFPAWTISHCPAPVSTASVLAPQQGDVRDALQRARIEIDHQRIAQI